MTADWLRDVETARIETHDGQSLVAWRYPAHRHPQPRGRVLLVHGYAEHAGRYEWVATGLGAAGYDCHLFDLRGHGRSGGPRGHVETFSDYLADLDRVILHTNTSTSSAGYGGNRQLPLFAVAHSFGGLIALEYVRLRRGAFDALVASSPFLAPAFTLPPLVEGVGSLVSRVLPTQTLKSPLKAAWMSHDATVVQAYAEDPLVFDTVTLGWYREVRHTQEEVFRRAGEIRLPVLFQLGDADRVADWEVSTEVFKRLGSTDKRLEVYPGLFHEILNEIGRERVLHDLLAWLNEQSAAGHGTST